MTAYRAVTPRIVAADPAGLVAWLIEVFGAAGEVVEGRPTDVVIGDSIVLVSGAGEARDEFPAFLYVYVDDADGPSPAPSPPDARSSKNPSTPPTATAEPW